MAAADSQPALATTKRKFHKLLDNLAASTSTSSLASSLQEANESTPSLQSLGSPEHPNKRPRSSGLSEERQRNISAGQERIRMLKEQFKTPLRANTVRVVGKKTETPAAPSPRRPPNFQPFSQEQFLSRLKTFADVKRWTSKPDAIGEVEWAKRGWSCDTWNTVACKGGCEKRVAVKLRPKRKDKDDKDIEMSEDLVADIDESLVKRYQSLIIAGHADDCLWKKQGCQEDIYHIAIASRNKSFAELLERYRSFKSVSADLPLTANIAYPDPTVQQILERVPAGFFPSSGPDAISKPSSPEDFVAFAFALFGWSGLSESRISLAVCNHCFQRLGLWLSSDDRLKEMSKRLDVSVESLRLNLLESHREHCPWKNAQVQGNSPDSPIADMAAWQTLEFMLLGRSRRTTATPDKAAHGHNKNTASVDMSGELEYPRGSFESDGAGARERDVDEEQESLGNKWKKLKAKLKRTASKKSLRSIKSTKSTKSSKSVVESGKEQEKS